MQMPVWNVTRGQLAHCLAGRVMGSTLLKLPPKEASSSAQTQPFLLTNLYTLCEAEASTYMMLRAINT